MTHIPEEVGCWKWDGKQWKSGDLGVTWVKRQTEVGLVFVGYAFYDTQSSEAKRITVSKKEIHDLNKLTDINPELEAPG